MNQIGRNIFKAVYEGKWLSIEYKNSKEEITKYWIGIQKINVKRKALEVEGLHLGRYTTCTLFIYVDSIISADIVDGSYYVVPEELKEDLRINPEKYKFLFHNVVNLKVLTYLHMCSKLDTTPYKCEYALIEKFDRDCLKNNSYLLNAEQFKEIVNNFQITIKNDASNKKMKQICVNVLSVYTKKGLYVLAYRRLRLDVKRRTLVSDDEVTVCTEFTINGEKQSIRKFLDVDDYYLLEDFEKNQEMIKNQIMTADRGAYRVDDMPYLIAIGRDLMLDLNKEYEAIEKMYEENKETVPIKAFFGDLLNPPVRKKDYPITLFNSKINIDQLLAIHNAIKYPLTYIQGPPGTGKTNTIINIIVTAFFNDRTVLFTSYNNHPIDSVCETLQNMKYRERTIPFPVIRLGNNEKIDEAMEYIKKIYERTRDLKIFDQTLEKNRDDKIARTKKLTELLEKYEKILDLNERKESVEKLLSTNNNLTFQVELQGEQLRTIEKQLNEIGPVTDEEAIELVREDMEEFKKYLYYTSAKYIKRLYEPKNEDLRGIVNMDDREKRIKAFHKYLSKDENLKKFTRIFPIIATTSISAHRVGEPKASLDMVIMDEASQGNTAISLVPIIRGENLVLVGDPQQLNPVILLDPKDNLKLRKDYSVPDEYDYIKNSIYKTYLACDSVSVEILLSHHYRCNRKIIHFNNKKYYSSKLVIDSQSDVKNPLIYVDVADNISYYKNTAPDEARKIIEYAKLNKDKNLGVITPFTNQKDLINEMLKENRVDNVTCGTVHAFQGDEKDEIIFSTAITNRTSTGTYGWLKNNKELINVATSRAKDKLILLCSSKELERLHAAYKDETDDMYELVQYVKYNGKTEITVKQAESRALGIKPYSTETEEAFLKTLNHALDNVLNTEKKCVVRKEVGISQVFQDNVDYIDLFYSGRFDFVVYERDYYTKKEFPILAIELDGKEHFESEIVKERDRKKNLICQQHGFELIRVENSYARRYNFIKEILIRYFNSVNRK